MGNKYVIKHKNEDKWFDSPGHGIVDSIQEAYRYNTRQEAKDWLADCDQTETYKVVSVLDKPKAKPKSDAKGPDLSILALQQEAFQIAKDHGFQAGVNPIPQQLMMMVSELSEAMEEYRKGTEPSYVHKGKPEGMAIELADAVIRIVNFFEEHNWDLTAAIATKMDYNRSRPYKHGGKRC